MLRRSKFLRENCPSYFDRIEYYFGHAFMVNDEHLAKPTGTRCAICFLHSELGDDEYMRRIVKFLEVEEVGFVLPMPEQRGHVSPFRDLNRFLTRCIDANGQVLQHSQSLVLAMRVLAHMKRNRAKRLAFHSESGDEAEAYEVDEDTVSMEAKMAISKKLTPSQVDEYEALVDAVFPPAKLKTREFWYCASNKTLLIHVSGAVEGELQLLCPKFNAFPRRKERHYITVMVSVGFAKVSVLDTFADVCCRSFVIGKDPPESTITTDGYRVLATLYARKLGRLKFRIRQSGLDGGEARIVVNPVANTVEMTSSYKLEHEEHVL